MESASKSKKIRVIDSFWTFLVAVAFLGPLALPLLWRNPRYSTVTKVAGSVAVLAFTYFLLYVAGDLMNSMFKRID